MPEKIVFLTSGVWVSMVIPPQIGQLKLQKIRQQGQGHA